MHVLFIGMRKLAFLLRAVHLVSEVVLRSQTKVTTLMLCSRIMDISGFVAQRLRPRVRRGLRMNLSVLSRTASKLSLEMEKPTFIISYESIGRAQTHSVDHIQHVWGRSSCQYCTLKAHSGTYDRTWHAQCAFILCIVCKTRKINDLWTLLLNAILSLFCLPFSTDRVLGIDNTACMTDNHKCSSILHKATELRMFRTR